MSDSNKPQLLLLSDMWGEQKSDWLPQYFEQLDYAFKVVFKNCRKLAEIDPMIDREEALHHEYVNGGIQHAVKKLSDDQTEYAALLGISIGGTIGWKAILNGLDVKHYYAVSATRLRFETQKPTCPIRLYFGVEDKYSPDIAWQKSMSLEAYNLHLDHDMYYEKVVTRLICNHIIFDPMPKFKEPITLKRKR